jgi:hypothetical protein
MFGQNFPKYHCCCSMAGAHDGDADDGQGGGDDGDDDAVAFLDR